MDGNRLADLIEQAGYKPRSYSGRFMYGKQCVGVVIESLGEAVRLGEKVALSATEDDREAMSRLSVRQDNMGLDFILYYPDVTWPKGRAESDDEDDY